MNHVKINEQLIFNEKKKLLEYKHMQYIGGVVKHNMKDIFNMILFRKSLRASVCEKPPLGV